LPRIPGVFYTPTGRQRGRARKATTEFDCRPTWHSSCAAARTTSRWSRKGRRTGSATSGSRRTARKLKSDEGDRGQADDRRVRSPGPSLGRSGSLPPLEESTCPGIHVHPHRSQVTSPENAFEYRTVRKATWTTRALRPGRPRGPWRASCGAARSQLGRVSSTCGIRLPPQAATTSPERPRWFPPRNGLLGHRPVPYEGLRGPQPEQRRPSMKPYTVVPGRHDGRSNPRRVSLVWFSDDPRRPSRLADLPRARWQGRRPAEPRHTLVRGSPGQRSMASGGVVASPRACATVIRR